MVNKCPNLILTDKTYKISSPKPLYLFFGQTEF
jgi:hypothetical protein